jgi:hypothetical protein
MSDAPEKIRTNAAGNAIVTPHPVWDTDVEYIRADHVDALLKAEREKALREAASLSWLCFHKCDVEVDVVTADDILALIENPAG